MAIITISEKEFISVYQPVWNHLAAFAPFDWDRGDGTMFETLGPELAFVRSQDPTSIWTLLSFEDSMVIVSGFRFSNRLGYFLTQKGVQRSVILQVDLEVP